uniref:Uncharacterized protein n=1 Tax=Fundulus heteroclitus TaxID=8078 RepID=A0A3Q2PX06_FUNHE
MSLYQLLCSPSSSHQNHHTLCLSCPRRALGVPTVSYEAKLFGISSNRVCKRNKPVSPYGNYTGQMRASVYQPTELALITKTGGNVSIKCYRATFAAATSTLQLLLNSLEPGKKSKINNASERKLVKD